MISVEKFRKIVDAQDFSKNASGAIRNTTQVYEEIRAHFPRDVAATRKIISGLQEALVARFFATGDIINPYYNVAYVLHDAARGDIDGTTVDVDWERVINIVSEHRASLSLLGLTDENAIILQPAAKVRGDVVKEMAKLGHHIDIADDGKFQLTTQTIDDIARDIDSTAMKVGGARLLKKVLEEMALHFDKNAERIQLVRDGRTLNTDPKSQRPLAFLYQLGAKHFHARSVDQSETCYQKLAHLATLSIALLDVQPFNSFINFQVSYAGIMDYLRSSVLYDSLFTLPQASYKHIHTLCSELIADPAFSKLSVNGAPIQTVWEVIAAALELALATKSITFTADQLCRKIGRSKNNVSRILDSIFSHSPKKLNEALWFPPFSTQIDSGFRPLIKIEGQVSSYWCPPISIAAPAALEALLAAIRSIDKQADTRVGTITEKIVRRALLQFGVPTKSGNYHARNSEGRIVDGECDLVVESEKKIVFIEIKKKPLTRAARSGNDVQLLVDLTDGLLSSQLQSLGHQALLKENGSLILEAGTEQETIVEYNGREVVRLSLVLLDFGSIQDRMTVQKFMQIIRSADLEANDQSLQIRLDKLAPKFTELKTLSTSLSLSGPFPFQDSYFLSIPQLLWLLERVNNESDFIKELTRLRNMATPMRDFYGEHLFAEKLAAYGEKLPARP